MRRMLQAISSGIAGALAVTLIHEGARRLTRRAPRMDVLGERVIARACKAAGVRPPRGRSLYWTALAGDLLANSIYFGIVGAGHVKRPWLRGLLLGGSAGAGAVALPPQLGLGRFPRGVRPRTKAMTVAWYVTGGLAAAAATRALEQRALARGGASEAHRAAGTA